MLKALARRVGLFDREATAEDTVRAYRLLLGREPESSAPLDYWTGRSIEELYFGLSSSAEFQLRTRRADPVSISSAFRTVLGREPDPETVDAYVGAQPDQLYAELLASNEARTVARIAGRDEIVAAYRTILGREPEEAATERRAGHTIPELYIELVKSEEFRSRLRSADEASITRAVRTVLRREPDRELLASYAGYQPDQLYAELLASDEARTVARAASHDDVVIAYQTILGREPEADAIGRWARRTIADLYSELVTSEEFQSRGKAGQQSPQLCDASDVLRAYKLLLGREPESRARTESCLSLPIERLYYEIANSAEFAARKTPRPSLNTTVYLPQYVPAVEQSKSSEDNDIPTAPLPTGFAAFLHANRDVLSNLNQYGSAYVRQLYQLFDALISPRTECVVEFGSGVSTLVIQELLAQPHGSDRERVFLSIDHNADWQRSISSALPFRSFTHLRTYDLTGYCETNDDAGPNYSTAPLMLQRSIDLAFVDGRSRAQSALAVASVLSPDGVIVLDDAGRERYRFLDRYFESAETVGRFKIFRKPVLAAARTKVSPGHRKFGILRVISGRQARIEADISRPSLERYAKAIGAELSDVIVAQENGHGLLKFLLSERLADFDRAIVVDCDVLVRPGAPNLFDLVPEDCVGAVREDRHVDRALWLAQMSELYRVPINPAAPGPYFNSGVMVLSRAHYELLQQSKPATVYGHPLFEQTYLNARLRQLGFPLYELPKEFNYIGSFDGKYAPDWRFGWVIHAAGSWNWSEWRHDEFWEVTGKVGEVTLRERRKLYLRHGRIAHLRALSEALERGRDLRVYLPANFKLEERQRLVYSDDIAGVGIDLAGDHGEIIVAGLGAQLSAGTYDAELHVFGRGANAASVTSQAISSDGTVVLDKAARQADADGILRFRISLPVAAELDVIIWGCGEDILLGSLTFERHQDPGKQSGALETQLAKQKSP